MRESVADFARVISQYVDALVVRTFAHATVEELARHATIPVINALSDAVAPLPGPGRPADDPARRSAASTGSSSSSSATATTSRGRWRSAAALLGLEFVLAAPPGYEFPDEFRARFAAAFPGIPLVVEHDPARAVAGADVVYTDVWASMGQEHEAERRRAAFAPFQVNADLLGRARPDAIFLHCLPAHRGEEVTAEVLDGPQQPGHPAGRQPAPLPEGAADLAASGRDA